MARGRADEVPVNVMNRRRRDDVRTCAMRDNEATTLTVVILVVESDDLDDANGRNATVTETQRSALAPLKPSQLETLASLLAAVVARSTST